MLIIQYAHNTEVPILSYNNETELSAIINLVYLAARDQYRVEREDKAGKGYVDFIFYPIRHDQDCMILELKVDHKPEEAIAQIKEKEVIHKCVVCGITEKEDPKMDFRYCSKCSGKKCYCENHIRNHEHK